jgi:cobalt-zinc-cadmium efflux system protein
MHDLHIWAMSTTETALTVHLVMPAGHPGDEFFENVIRQIDEKFNIGHATIQIETGTSSSPCVLAPDHVV